MGGDLGVSVLLWITTNSTTGERLFGRYNLFAYSFCDSMGAKWNEWAYGTLIQILLSNCISGIDFDYRKEGVKMSVNIKT